MKMRFLKADRYRELHSQIELNLDLYRNGNFDFLNIDTSCYIDTVRNVDEGLVSQIDCDQDNHHEIQNCLLLYEAMGDLSLYHARDERLWVYLLHTQLLQYSRNRWPIPQEDDKAIKHISLHFFVNGVRGFERDNAISRLWWMASLCNRVKELSLEEYLTCFLEQYDVRANIIERPNTSQNTIVFSSILLKLSESFKKDKKFFDREFFRSAMKNLNLIGGTKLLSALDKNTINLILDDCFRVSPVSPS